ncbi:hypothetical protein PNK_p0136 (plasmid) [Candidatus Protochlamydia naegleriophila]|uniref:Uncharacterized protein n=1 Tax=Candidatus Protochlamydia naegleriophila TaxID=389348 RepID=A0A0U5CSY0_9BACT|nr:hypothetical protein PNK_p0136 [Candidatus Protochlamydia naegleriophila]
MPGFSWQEAQIVCEAMVENSHLTFMYQEIEEFRLFLAFELAGYQFSKHLSYKPIVNPTTGRGTWGCVIRR